MNKSITNGRVTRWLLLLQGFNMKILDRLGKEKKVVDFLSRIQNDNKDVPVKDNFPMNTFLQYLLNLCGL